MSVFARALISATALIEAAISASSRVCDLPALGVQFIGLGVEHDGADKTEQDQEDKTSYRRVGRRARSTLNTGPSAEGTDLGRAMRL